MIPSKSDFRDRILTGLADRRKAKNKAKARLDKDIRVDRSIRYWKARRNRKVGG